MAEYRQIVLPLCKPAMAALATLLSLRIHNDFFWAIVLISTGENMPITSALNNPSGQYFTDPDPVAADALLAAIPTLIVHFVQQRQFVGGLTLGANKGRPTADCAPPVPRTLPSASNWDAQNGT